MRQAPESRVLMSPLPSREWPLRGQQRPSSREHRGKCLSPRQMPADRLRVSKARALTAMTSPGIAREKTVQELPFDAEIRTENAVVALPRSWRKAWQFLRDP